jgi:cytochrome c oxidase cbb3-type subunit 3
VLMILRSLPGRYFRVCGLLVCVVLLFLGGVLSSGVMRAIYERSRVKWARDTNAGRVLFLSNCAPCHGSAARGGRGPALVGRRLLHGSSEKEILAVVNNGIPGSAMPAFEGNGMDEYNIVAYVRSLSGSGVSSASHAQGDVARGLAVYERLGCAGCHMIGNRGSVFGPELTRVGAGRSYEYLKQALLDPSADIAPGAEAITATTLDGTRVVGIRINEDTFTLQLRDSSQRFIMLEKSELKSVTHETNSLMPTYATLSKADLEDLLAYLSTLHGEVNAGVDSAPRWLQ